MASIQTLGIVGSGTMGNGIAYVAVRSGYKVVLFDIESAALDRALATIAKNMDREVAKNKLSATDRDAALARITTVTDNGALGQADFVIEAVVEDLETKGKVFQTLDQITNPGVILASNTSSISITRIASKTNRPSHVIGMHFMNPVPVMALVEIIRG